MNGSVRSAFAFITDIHGNMTALDAVLNDVNSLFLERNFDRVEIVCLGDSFDGGSDPARVFDRLSEIGCIHLLGNHEDYLFECLDKPTQEKFLRPLWRFVPWTVAQMGPSLLRLREMVCQRWRNDEWNLTGVHASASNNSRVPDFFTTQSRLSPAFVSEHTVSDQGCIVFNGHSHYLGKHRSPALTETWFNCGSVGYPFVEKEMDYADAPVATWVWVECERLSGERRVVTVRNRRVPYSSDALLRRFVESGALECCAPFSFAILAQSLFNVDVVYPFFMRTKDRNLNAGELASLLIAELENQSIFTRIDALLHKAGLEGGNWRL